MNKSSPIFWLIIFLLLLVPGATGKFVINIAGGLIILLLCLPILIAGIGWIGWKIIQSKFESCESCGTAYLNTSSECPICGQKTKDINASSKEISQPANTATIDIEAEDAS